MIDSDRPAAGGLSCARVVVPRLDRKKSDPVFSEKNKAGAESS
ncbi:MAG: hypothetical protein PHF23_07475 [Smithellaceae bacterium]|jgi:hypothetical protein|nr:hypothetical protein [Smithellaceae bacterium]